MRRIASLFIAIPMAALPLFSPRIAAQPPPEPPAEAPSTSEAAEAPPTPTPTAPPEAEAAEAPTETEAAEAEAAEAPPAPTPSAPTAHPGPNARVVGTRGNDVIIDVGRESGVEEGQRVEIYEDERIDLGDGETAYERHPIAVGEVTALSGRRALVRLGLDEHAPVGSGARPTEEEVTASAIAPPRVGGYWSFAATSRIFVVTRAVGGGLLGDAAITYRGERPFFVQLLVPASGFTLHRDSDSTGRGLESASAANVFALAGFDHRFVGFGAGFGVSRILPKVYDGYDDGGPTTTSASAGFSFLLHARFGTLDGLHLAGEVGLTTLVDASRISHVEVRAQIPFTQTLALVLRGGGGFEVTGALYGEVAARMRVRGEGGAGTLLVSPFLGYARLSERAEWGPDYSTGEPTEPWDLEDRRGGPSAGVTVEYRF